jgi:hypothetical protein
MAQGHPLFFAMIYLMTRIRAFASFFLFGRAGAAGMAASAFSQM